MGVRRALAEMLEAPDPRAFFGKLREAVGHVRLDQQDGADRMLVIVERWQTETGLKAARAK